MFCRNVFAEDGSSKLDASALPAVMSFTRYIRRECICLSLTGTLHFLAS
ncbi:hypothetical protein M8C21_026296 [Ambrosia artemisiifolia]|uniref:Uncharacterized protein n=1 Tax=Ambrosia artemisiifolia TaxID=4212 RepID=A0AAD5CZZ2_AMBAR|nr:hypothetical protein M8C21_026296 [Ambrosia artemisiifolia]